MMPNIEIKASIKLTGKRRTASVEAARRKVKDGEFYLIRRHGGYFRPDAHGYTDNLAAAGIYGADCARGYLDVEGLSVVPLRKMRGTIKAQITEAEQVADSLKTLLLVASFNVTP